LSRSTNPHDLNFTYFGGVKMNGKSIRHHPDTLVIVAGCCKPTARIGPKSEPVVRPAGIANELAPDANARTMGSVGTQRIEASEHLGGRVAEWLKAPDSKL
jgi:hypothetical protein